MTWTWDDGVHDEMLRLCARLDDLRGLSMVEQMALSTRLQVLLERIDAALERMSRA